MMIKNFELTNLFKYLPIVTLKHAFLGSIMRGKVKARLKALFWILNNLKEIWMERLKIQYTIRKDKIAEAKKAIDDYVTAVYANEPGVINFDVYSTKDDLTYIHMVTCQDEEARDKFDNAPYRVTYLESFFEYCETIAQGKELNLLKSKRM